MLAVSPSFWRVTLLLAPTFRAFASPLLPRGNSGTLILAGGAIDANNAAIYGEFVRLAGGSSAKIGVITAASALPKDDPDANNPDKCSNSVCNAAFYANILKGTYGVADAPWVAVDLDHISANSDKATVDQINSMTGFFIGGGDQSRLVTCFVNKDGSDSPALAALRAKLAGGAVVIGTSAGSTIFNGKDMVTGGESYEALLNGVHDTVSDSHPNDLSYDAQGGFGFITSALVDVHFGARGRQGRMVRLAAERKHDRVYGVDENTALVVTNVGGQDESLRVIGALGVSVLDLRSAQPGTRSGSWSITGVHFTYLTAGDSYAVSSGTVTTTKEVYKPSSGQVGQRPDDVFSTASQSAMQLIDMTSSLIDAGASTTQYGVSHEDKPTYEAHVTKDGNTLAWKDGKALSWQGVLLDFYVF